MNQLTNDLEKKFAGCKEVVYDLEKELNVSNDDEILPFIWNKLAFNKAKELLEINNNEINDEISWENISFDEITETELIITARTADDEINYQLEESSDQLTSCVLLDLIDGKIQCCSKLTQKLMSISTTCRYMGN